MTDLARLKQFCAEHNISLRPFYLDGKHRCRSYLDNSFCGVSMGETEADAIWEELDRISEELEILVDAIRRERAK